MQKLKQIYRSTYAGENIITDLNLSDSEWEPTIEFVPNQVFNTHTTKQAVCIGNGETRLKFDLGNLTRHKGGLLAVDRLQSYGCNALYRDFAPDFLVINSDDIINEVTTTDYCDNHIVYANAENLLKHPGKFYLIPQNPYFDSGALAAYMACFDGHKKVYLIGYDQYTAEEPVNNIYKDTPGYLPSTATQNAEYFAKTLSQVIDLYPDVDFVRVMPVAAYMLHPLLARLPNLRQITYRDFVVEADIG